MSYRSATLLCYSWPKSDSKNCAKGMSTVTAPAYPFWKLHILTPTCLIVQHLANKLSRFSLLDEISSLQYGKCLLNHGLVSLRHPVAQIIHILLQLLIQQRRDKVLESVQSSWIKTNLLHYITQLLLLLLCIYTQRNISIYYRTQSAI